MRERLSVPPEKPADATSGAAQVTHPVHTLAALLSQLQAATPDAVASWLAHTPVASLVAEGQKVTTARLLTEGAELAGAAFDALAQMSPSQRAIAPAFDEHLVGAAVGCLAECERRGGSRQEATASAAALGGKNRRSRDALAKRVKAQRAIVYTTAITLTGADPVRRAALDDAWGAGADPAHLARSHGALVELLREAVADARARKAPVSVTDAWLDAQASSAAALAALDGEAAARAAAGDVAQGDVAWWRGAALWFLKQAADLVDGVNAVDPRVARLPLGGLRSVLRHPSSKRKKKADAPKKDPTAPDAPKPA